MHNDTVVLARGYGMANLEHGIPLQPGTVFDIASVSKQFGAMAIALLEADGKLRMSDDVRTYIPELGPFESPITINHLVHHTSGLRDWPGTLRIAGWNFEDVMSFEQIQRMAFRQRSLNFAPGSAYAYSNTGYNMLALVVQRVSGMSFRQFTESRIFAPLGMTSTHFHDDHDEVVPGLAASYRPGANGAHYYVPNNLTALGSSSLFTNVEDLSKWIRNFSNPVVGSPPLITRLHERGVLTNGDTIAYAFGQNVERYRGVTRVSHTGSWAGYRTVLQRYPDQRFAVVILANTSGINPTALANTIADVYLGATLTPITTGMAPAATPAAGAATAPWTPRAAELREYAGRYDCDELDTFWTLQVRNDTLVASHFRVGDVVLYPVARDLFRSGMFGDVQMIRDAKKNVVAFTANADRVRNLRFSRARP
jgi:CubicO group peptidase (beta-lactamase class C family)